MMAGMIAVVTAPTLTAGIRQRAHMDRLDGMMITARDRVNRCRFSRRTCCDVIIVDDRGMAVHLRDRWIPRKSGAGDVRKNGPAKRT